MDEGVWQKGQVIAKKERRSVSSLLEVLICAAADRMEDEKEVSA